MSHDTRTSVSHSKGYFRRTWIFSFDNSKGQLINKIFRIADASSNTPPILLSSFSDLIQSHIFKRATFSGTHMSFANPKDSSMKKHLNTEMILCSSSSVRAAQSEATRGNTLRQSLANDKASQRNAISGRSRKRSNSVAKLPQLLWRRGSELTGAD